MPEDEVTLGVGSSLAPEAHDVSDRMGRPSTGGVGRVVARRVWGRVFAVRAGLGRIVGEETEGVDVSEGVEMRGELGGALTVVEGGAVVRAPGAGSGRIEG